MRRFQLRCVAAVVPCLVIVMGGIGVIKSLVFLFRSLPDWPADDVLFYAGLFWNLQATFACLHTIVCAYGNCFAHFKDNMNGFVGYEKFKHVIRKYRSVLRMSKYVEQLRSRLTF